MTNNYNKYNNTTSRTQQMQNSQDLKLPPITNPNNQGPFKITSDNQMLMNADNTNKSRTKQQKIWEKGTASCRNPLKRFDKYQTAIDDKYVPVSNFNNKEKKLIESALEIIQMRKKNKDLLAKNQTIVDVLEQKKQMFLVTMTHGIIEKQIKNLKDQADERQKALKESNQILNQDIQDFEQFQEKEKTETKSIQEKYEKQVQKRLVIEQQIKNKQITFNSLRAEKSKNQQNISSYEKYKKFLNQLPPEDWINTQQMKKQNRLKELKQKMYKQWVQNQDKKQPQNKLKFDFQMIFTKLKESGQNQDIEQILNNEEMYFKQPHELIEYFNNLEQANLFCIQNVQVADQKLQQLIIKSNQHETELKAKYQGQQQQKRALQRQLIELQNQLKVLKKKKEQNSIPDNLADTKQYKDKDIKSTIASEYQYMKEQMTLNYLPEIQQNAEALALLSGIQICMERLWDKLRELYNQNPKIIKESKNQYEKKKTTEKREKAARSNNQQELRRKQRNMQKKEPINKVYGRTDMKRSAPHQKLVKKKAETNNKDINDDHQYLVQ